METKYRISVDVLASKESGRELRAVLDQIAELVERNTKCELLVARLSVLNNDRRE